MCLWLMCINVYVLVYGKLLDILVSVLQGGRELWIFCDPTALTSRQAGERQQSLSI